MLLKKIMNICNAEIGDSIFLACGKKKEVENILSISRNKIAQDLNIIDKDKICFFAGLLITLCMNMMKS